MATGRRTPTIESKALSIAIKRAMAMRDIKTPALAEEIVDDPDVITDYNEEIRSFSS